MVSSIYDLSYISELYLLDLLGISSERKNALRAGKKKCFWTTFELHLSGVLRGFLCGLTSEPC